MSAARPHSTSIHRAAAWMSDERASRRWVGFDLGGTKMMAATFSGEFRLLGRKRRKTKGSEGVKAGLERIVETIRDSLEEGQVKTSQLSGIGVGCPGNIDLDKGLLIDSA